jgi:N-acetylglucosaminyldiphosphoundecaprenol N-acetyl-beta-D-mannosaminyltransferase
MRNQSDQKDYRTILGINFFVGTLDGLLSRAQQGGLVVVPAAPALAELKTNAAYRDSVEQAEFAIVDSSFLVLLWFLRKGQFLRRISGLQFMRGLVGDPAFRRPGATFWVMPSAEDATANVAWLKSQGIRVEPDAVYLAPHYARDRIEDGELLRRLEAHRPAYVVINIGGGTQEILGRYLASRLTYTPAIICTGAAIAFLSGRQASIHPWLDRLMVAWLVRCLSDPRRFVPRYLRAYGLVGLLLRYGDRSVGADSTPA